MGEAFTSGPWFAAPFLHEDGDPTLPRSCSIGTFDLADRPGQHHYEETICEVWDGNHVGEANAALIAAAPDLYGALEGLLAECIEAGHGQDRDYGWPEKIANASAALAKACPTPTVAATDNEGGE